MSSPQRPKAINIVIGIGIFAFVFTLTYWVLWFAAPGVVQSRMPGDTGYESYAAYELAFPLPDAFMACAALAGVIGLWRMRDWGLFSMLLASGGAIFLGLEDLLFDLENHIFIPFTAEALIELLIVLLIFTLGPIMTILLWQHRKAFI